MTQALNTLIERINTKRARIGIVGLGYVGLPLMLRFIEARFEVLGFDVDAARVAQLNEGKSYIGHIPDEAIAKARKSGFEASYDMSRAGEVDALILCVPTPLNKHREPDISYITSCMEELLPHLQKGQVISLESTTYPGTTEEELLPRLQGRGFSVGEDMFLVYSPEREDPGNKKFETRTIPKVCGGATPECLKAGMALYGVVIDHVVPMSSTKAAEMTKLLENIHRAVNIGLVNELKMVCDRMGLDIYEIIRGAATKPFGFVPYFPGPGLGGHCIPVDPFYLTWKAREYGVNTKFIELAGEVNRAMPEWVVGKVVEALNAHGKPVRGSKVHVLGAAYKKNVDDVRESPAIELMHLLHARGALISYSDPHVTALSKQMIGVELEHQEPTEKWLKSVDCVLVATDHAAFDFGAILEHSALIVDSRGVYLQPSEKVVKA